MNASWSCRLESVASESVSFPSQSQPSSGRAVGTLHSRLPAALPSARLSQGHTWARKGSARRNVHSHPLSATAALSLPFCLGPGSVLFQGRSLTSSGPTPLTPQPIRSQFLLLWLELTHPCGHQPCLAHVSTTLCLVCKILIVHKLSPMYALLHLDRRGQVPHVCPFVNSQLLVPLRPWLLPVPGRPATPPSHACSFFPVVISNPRSSPADFPFLSSHLSLNRGPASCFQGKEKPSTRTASPPGTAPTCYLPSLCS